MVLEVFAAISLASNILQFVDFGGKLFAKAREVHHSADGTTKDYAYLEAATERLKRLKDDLASSASTVSRAVVNSGEDRELKILAKDCTELADELSNLLEKLKGRKRKRKRNYLQAILLTLNENEINDAKSRLKEFQTRVTVSLSNILRNNQSVVIKVLMELSDRVHEGETRAKDLLTMKDDVISKLNDVLKLSDDDNKKSDDLSSKLSDIASTLSKWATTGNQFAAEHHILKSLRFRSMDVRHAQITEAHSKTFEWAYTSRSNSDSSCTQFKFAEWLRSGNGHYWVAGKAGSGKSTLMKFLYDNPRTISELEHWSEQKDLVTACFFFWNSGTERQKSVEGLLQSLLHEILRKSPSLIPIAAPKRWEERYSYHSEPAPWFQREIKDAFRRIQEQGTFSAKFCLFIDGLDEYGGDHPDLINILQDLTTCENFKLCISSRPWNIFRDAFGQDPERRLFLEELTKPDIELYVRDKLESSSQFKSLLTTDTRYGGLVEEIVQKADGVFLWVHLVVRSLLQGLVNCDRFSELERRVQLLPSTLEEYFMQTFSTINEAYSERAAETFNIALQAFKPLSLMTYSYLDEEDPYYGINASIEPIPPQEAMHRLRTMKRRLNARCNGLLEVVAHDFESKELLSKSIDGWDWPSGMDNIEDFHFFRLFHVDFLHRTVRDFLSTEEIQNLIKQRISSDFQPPSAICRALLAQVKAFPMHDIENHDSVNICSKSFIIDLFSYARMSEEKLQRPETRTLDELERTLLVFSPVWRIETKLQELRDFMDDFEMSVSYIEHLVQNGLYGYVSNKLCSPSNRRSRPSISKLLSAALVPILDFSSTICYFPSMVELLIRLSEDERTHAWTKTELPSIWVEFLVSIPKIWELLRRKVMEDQLQIIRMLLDIGANPTERHNGCLVWENTLQKLEDYIAREEIFLYIDKSQGLEFIERYKNIFQSAIQNEDAQKKSLKRRRCRPAGSGMRK